MMSEKAWEEHVRRLQAMGEEIEEARKAMETAKTVQPLKPLPTGKRRKKAFWDL